MTQTNSAPDPRPAVAAGTDPRLRLTGIGLMLLALVMFAVLDATAKWLTAHIGTMEVIWARYAGQLVLVGLAVKPWLPDVWRTERLGLHLLRAVFLLGTTAGNFVALRFMQLDQALSIAFSMPFFVALLAGPMLGEWIGPRRWIAIVVGFCGVLIIIRPSTAGIHPAVLGALAGALSYALYNITTRILAPTESTATLMFYASLAGTIAVSLPLPFVWSVPQSPEVVLNMALMGLYGTIGHVLLVTAHRRAPAPVLAPFLYTQIIWTTIAGWVVFAQVPHGWTLVGAAVVIASGLYLLYRERADHADRAIEASLTE